MTDSLFTLILLTPTHYHNQGFTLSGADQIVKYLLCCANKYNWCLCTCI